MKIPIEELKSLYTASNYVALSPAVDTSKIKHGIMELFAPVSLADGKPYDQFKQQPIVCRVVAHPKRLIAGTRKVFWESVEELDLTPEQKMYLYRSRREAKFSETTQIEVPVPGSMPWYTPMEVKWGDIVWVSANSLMNAESKGQMIDTTAGMVYLLKYEDLYLKKDGDKVKMLNGWVLAEPIDDIPQWTQHAEKIGLSVPDYMKRKGVNDRLGIIRYIGEPVTYVLNDMYDHPQIKKGDTVLFKWKLNRRLEPGAKYFGCDNDLIVTRRDRIMAVMS